jgi:hypothetical protein
VRPRRLRLATAVAVVMVVGVPMALAGYTGTYTPTESVAAFSLTPPALSCTAPGNDYVSLTWTNPNSGADPYTPANYRITGFVIDRKVGGAAFVPAWATAGPTATGVEDHTNFGALALGTQVSYKIHTTKSTNWISTDSNTVTATVVILLIIKQISCP